jgi:hypothetical protein
MNPLEIIMFSTGIILFAIIFIDDITYFIRHKGRR